jgi:hypothetical protein
MDTHACNFSIMRLRARYRGNPYDLDECEDCGILRLATGPESERRIVLSGSVEFGDVLDFFEFLIRTARKTVLATCQET